MTDSSKKRIVILGAGFGGLSTAMNLEKLLAWHDDFEIVLINRENYFVFQPMLAEIISGHVGVFDTVSPLRQLLRKTEIMVRDVEHVDLEARVIRCCPGFLPVPQYVHYDYLVLALGNVTDFRGLTGLMQHALPFKTMEDALQLRHHIIHTLEEASIEQDEAVRKALLTFVVAGGGWSGVECVAEMNSLIRQVARTYRHVNPDDIRMILLHNNPTILEQLALPLRELALKELTKYGIEVRLNTLLTAATGAEAIVNGEERIPTRTLVSTVPSSPNPVIDALLLPKERGRIKTDEFMQVEGRTDIWCVGDCAWIHDPSDRTGLLPCPPTAQHAVRQGTVCAYNIVTAIRGGKKKAFHFKGLGMMGALGHHSAVAQLFGFRFHGFLAFLLWRAVYLCKMPGWDRKLRTLFAWITYQIVPVDIVQLSLPRTGGVVEEHYEPGQVIFHQGDLGDRLYIIKSGCVEVIRTDDGGSRCLATLGAGDYFGEMALLNKTTRGATVRAREPLDVLSVPKHDISAMLEYLPALRESFQEVVAQREQLNRMAQQVSRIPSLPSGDSVGGQIVLRDEEAHFSFPD